VEKMIDLGTEIEKLKNRIHEKKQKVKELENKMIFESKSKIDELIKLESIIKEKDTKLEERQEKIMKLKQDIEKFKIESDEKNKKIDELGKIKDEKESEISSLKDKIDRLTEEIENKDKIITSQKEEINNIKQDMDKVIDEIKENYEKKINEIKEEYKKIIEDTKSEVEKELNTSKAKYEEELNKIKSELKEKIEDLEKRNKELEDKLKGVISNIDNIKIFNDRQDLIKHINEIIKDAKIRLMLVFPKLEDMKDIDLEDLDNNIAINLATNIDLKNSDHTNFLRKLQKKYNINIRNKDPDELWCIKKDGDSLIIGTILENGRFFGFYSNDRNIVNLFSGIVSDATLRAKRVVI